MAMIAVVGAKGAPGATTSVLALACGWPGPVLVADADLSGGDIAVGWLGGRVGLDRGLLSFAAATRHTNHPTAADLALHAVAVPDVPGVMVLPGLAHAGQAGGLDGRVWGRLAAAAATPWPAMTAPVTRHGGPGPARDDPRSSGTVLVDVLVDCGRIGVDTAWPLLAAAELVLVATRPTLRSVVHTRHAVAVLRAELGGVARVGLLVCGPGPYDPGEVGQAIGVPARVVLPDDPDAAAALSDGAATRSWSRTVLARAARTATTSLAKTAASAALTSAAVLGAAVSGQAPGSWPPIGPAPVRPSSGEGVRR